MCELICSPVADYRSQMTDDIRSQLHWLRTQQKADALLAAETAAKIIRAGQIRRGEIKIAEPTDETAKQILAAGRKRRGEIK